jgi:hypothetical protein
MPRRTAGSGTGVQEDRRSRVNRELIELLNELRVALPGVQVLFGFMLVLPFQAGFSKLDSLATYVYFGGMVAAAIAIMFLIAPATYHRLAMRAGTAEKEEMLFTSSRFALVGTAFLGISIACSLFVVTDALFGSELALLLAGAAVAFIVFLWYGVPLWRRRPGTGERAD